MSDFKIIPVTSEMQIQKTAELASIIWNEHFVPIIGQAQVDYMVDKFQSFPALSRQIEKGYEYFQLILNDKLVGYTGVQEQNDDLFLSKLYIHKDFRGNGFSRKTVSHLITLCKERDLTRIWLTCNKYNSDTLAVYTHLGFQVIDNCQTDIGKGFIMDDYVLEYLI